MYLARTPTDHDELLTADPTGEQEHDESQWFVLQDSMAIPLGDRPLALFSECTVSYRSADRSSQLIDPYRVHW
jgi:hypothetical protein